MDYTDPKVYEFISDQTGDPIVERKTCRISGAKFAIFQSDLDFYDKVSPVFGGKKCQIPVSDICPEERNRNRVMFRNERSLYRRKCDATGETIVSIYSPDSPYKVYDQKVRESDKRDALEYARDFDFGKTFTEQFKELTMDVPRMGIMLINCENCEYSNIATNAKNCYLSSVNSRSEDSHYCSRVVHSKDDIDCYKCGNVDNSYRCYKCNHSSNLYYCYNTVNSYKCYFSSHLDGCKFCFNCNNLVNQEYCIDNEYVGKEEFEKRFPELRKTHLEKGLEIKGTSTNVRNFNSSGCIGDNLTECKDCIMCFDILKGENCKYYCDAGGDQKDSWDVSFGGENSLSFECLSAMGHKHLFSTFPWNGSNIIYSDQCQNCNNVFGCVGLRNKEYCIFNKQYSQKEYEELVPQIIEHMVKTGEWGKFFDPLLSPFAYNETVAGDYMPLTKEQAIARGYRWQDNSYDPVVPEGIKTLTGNEIPRDITQVDDSILKRIFVCEISGRPFRIIQQELDFYRKHNLPLPRKHPDVRHQERTALRPGRTLYIRKCDKTGEEMLSVYPQDVAFDVYSEEAYQNEVYS